MSEMRPGLLVLRTHRVALYAPADDGAAEDEWGHPTGGSFNPVPVATDVECNLQPLTGSVEQTAAGREVNADWQGSFPEATALLPGHGIVVTAVSDDGETWNGVPASHPTHFRVQHVGYKGDGWDTEAMLRATAEAIPS